MGAVRGMLTGALGLIALEVLVQPEASQRASTLPGLIGTTAKRFLDPTVPAFGPIAPRDGAGGSSPSGAVPEATAPEASAPTYPNPTTVPGTGYA